MKLMVVIPAYNEAERITEVIEGVRSVVASAEIIVVDDGSTDATTAAALESGAIVLRLHRNSGYGTALKAGYIMARKDGADILVQMDADGQHDPGSIKVLLAAMDDPEVDVVIGSRFLSHRRYRMPFARRIGNSLFRFLLGFLTRRRFSDPTSGFQAIRGSVLNYYTSELFPSKYPDADVILFLWKAGMKVVEVPAIFHPSPDGKKSIHSGLKPFLYVPKMIISMIRTLVRPVPVELRNHKTRT